MSIQKRSLCSRRWRRLWPMAYGLCSRRWRRLWLMTYGIAILEVLDFLEVLDDMCFTPA